MNVNVRTAHAHLRALEDAIDANDRSRHDHEFTILVVIDQKWEQLEREANECTGVGPYEAFGRTRVTVWVVGVPDEDPTLIMDQGILFDVVTPPPSSGMM